MDDQHVGVWLDTPRLERSQPGLLERQFPNLMARTHVSNVDPRTEPLLVHPTLHYQNGGVVIDTNGATTVPGLYAIGETSFTGLHGANRLADNALSECQVFGRIAGEQGARHAFGRALKEET